MLYFLSRKPMHWPNEHDLILVYLALNWKSDIYPLVITFDVSVASCKYIPGQKFYTTYTFSLKNHSKAFRFFAAADLSPQLVI